jgi:elongation factor Ts
MAISAGMVKELREKTGAGIMDCKKALQESDGDYEKATEWLRKKGMAGAQKRASKETKEGLIDSYIHPGNRIGVLIEVNCETDFVARNDEFRQFVRNMAMQVAAANPLVVERQDLSPELVEKELSIYKEQAIATGKPEHIIEKIAQGKLEKYYQEVCLLEQTYIRDPERNVEDILNELRAKIGESINIKRFVRYQLGE